MPEKTQKDSTEIVENDETKTTTKTHEESGTPEVKETDKTVETRAE